MYGFAECTVRTMQSVNHTNLWVNCLLGVFKILVVVVITSSISY